MQEKVPLRGTRTRTAIKPHVVIPPEEVSLIKEKAEIVTIFLHYFSPSEQRKVPSSLGKIIQNITKKGRATKKELKVEIGERTDSTMNDLMSTLVSRGLLVDEGPIIGSYHDNERSYRLSVNGLRIGKTVQKFQNHSGFTSIQRKTALYQLDAYLILELLKWKEKNNNEQFTLADITRALYFGKEQTVKTRLKSLKAKMIEQKLLKIISVQGRKEPLQLTETSREILQVLEDMVAEYQESKDEAMWDYDHQKSVNQFKIPKKELDRIKENAKVIDVFLHHFVRLSGKSTEPTTGKIIQLAWDEQTTTKRRISEVLKFKPIDHPTQSIKKLLTDGLIEFLNWTPESYRKREKIYQLTVEGRSMMKAISVIDNKWSFKKMQKITVLHDTHAYAFLALIKLSDGRIHRTDIGIALYENPAPATTNWLGKLKKELIAQKLIQPIKVKGKQEPMRITKKGDRMLQLVEDYAEAYFLHKPWSRAVHAKATRAFERENGSEIFIKEAEKRPLEVDYLSFEERQLWRLLNGKLKPEFAQYSLLDRWRQITGNQELSQTELRGSLRKLSKKGLGA